MFVIKKRKKKLFILKKIGSFLVFMVIQMYSVSGRRHVKMNMTVAVVG